MQSKLVLLLIRHANKFLQGQKQITECVPQKSSLVKNRNGICKLPVTRKVSIEIWV